MEQSTAPKAWTEVAEIQLTYSSNISPSKRPQVNSSWDAYSLVINYWDACKIELQEQFKLLLLNRANKVLGLVHLSTGGTSGTVVDAKLVFAAALKAKASYIILLHNHPSGNLKCSKADQEMTAKLKMAGQLLELPVIDHIIVSAEGFLSFADEGLI